MAAPAQEEYIDKHIYSITTVNTPQQTSNKTDEHDSNANALASGPSLGGTQLLWRKLLMIIIVIVIVKMVIIMMTQIQPMNLKISKP